PQRAEELIDNPDETDDLLGLGLHRLPIGEFPLLRGRAPVLSYDGAAELERGLDILLAGLTATLALPDQAPAPAVRALRRPPRFRAPRDPGGGEPALICCPARPVRAVALTAPAHKRPGVRSR